MASAQHSEARAKSVPASEPPQSGDESTHNSGSHPRSGLQHSSPEDSTSAFLELPVEVRLQICFEAVKSARPFLIGRCQDETRRKTNGSPRDFFPRPAGAQYNVKRNDEPNRPVQPAITRVCWQLRNEALPVFYAENDFWLIHNEFRDNDGDSDIEDSDDDEIRRRNFESWIAETPSQLFDLMQHVTLCGYLGMPRRVMIEVDIKHRRVGVMRWYNTFGDELPIENWQTTINQIRSTLSDSAHSSGLSALKAALVAADRMWDISEYSIYARPFARGDAGKQPKEGWEYDW
jgi:hypothetical protein